MSLFSANIKAITLVTTVALLCSAKPGFASQRLRSTVEAGPRRTVNCEGLAGLKIASTNLLSATKVQAAANLPAYCRVLGYVRPAVNFELRMPLSGWNGKFYMTGCGGMCGSLEQSEQIEGFERGLRRGYAVSTMDGGHWGSDPLDARFATDGAIPFADFAYRAVDATAVVSKVLITTYYGTAIQSSYFEGCSTGGRQGLMEAQRYPAEFDGIIVGSPAFDAAGLVQYWTWISQTDVRAGGGSIFPSEKIPLLQKAVANACADSDGLIEDPRNCQVDLSTLRCGADPRNDCLTEAELRVAQKWYAGPRSRSGAKLFSDGVPYGSEAFWSRPGLPPKFGDVLNFQRAAAFAGLAFLMVSPVPGDQFKVADFDLDRDRERLQAADRILTPTPELEAFAAHGGKLLIYQGWADPVTPPLRLLDYYASAARSATVEQSLRLFMIPGFNHCGGSAQSEIAGVDKHGIDPLNALEDWVQHKHPPESLPMTKRDKEGMVLWVRPICAYPSTAVQKAGSNPHRPTSWSCTIGR